MLRPSFPIRTERLDLRPFSEGDIDDAFELHTRADVVRYLPWIPQTRDEVAAQIPRWKAMTAIDGESEGLRLVGMLRATGARIGEFSFWRHSAEHQSGVIGYVLHPDHQGHGYATEAAREFLRLGFDELDLHRISASADARNAPSIRVMERIGMRREAHFRENEVIRGEWTDEVVYAILQHEWRAMR